MYDNWEDLENSIKNCNRCKLCSARKSIVFGIQKRRAEEKKEYENKWSVASNRILAI